jgi:hypothetical protein
VFVYHGGVLFLPQLKRYSRCKAHKALEDFNRLTKASDGRQSYCRACNAAWHAENRAHHNALIHERRKRVRELMKARVLQYLVEHPCVDCGETDVLVLEFDHLRDKRSEVTRMAYTHDWPAIEREIAKCEVVCANCHRRRTATRAASYRWRSIQDGDVGAERLELSHFDLKGRCSTN